MSEENINKLIKDASVILEHNNRGIYTQPADTLYPHQWFWDSCFIAIGLRHTDIDRAKLELQSLLRGQWQNGMIPNILFRDDTQYAPARNQWRSWLSPYAPSDIVTSGITQPPLLAEAVIKVGEKLAWSDRRQWYRLMYEPLVNYHTWLYRDRDPHHEGLVLQIHPWEIGLDNTPPWMAELHEHLMPVWIRTIEKLKMDWLVSSIRTDTKKVPLKERSSVAESLALFDTQLRLRRKSYDINKILDHSLFNIEDLTFNSILIRANSHLMAIAKALKEDLPEDLLKSINKTPKALEELWEPYSTQYYSRDFVTHRLLKTPSIATLMPLYAGTIKADRANQLVKLLENDQLFGTAYPIPSVPPSSSWFNAKRYWQGPTWVNTNWLIIDGLKRYGFNEQAKNLTEKTIAMVKNAGFYEYFDPLNGEPAGVADFSWTAALFIDLVVGD